MSYVNILRMEFLNLLYFKVKVKAEAIQMRTDFSFKLDF